MNFFKTQVVHSRIQNVFKRGNSMPLHLNALAVYMHVHVSYCTVCVKVVQL